MTDLFYNWKFLPDIPPHPSTNHLQKPPPPNTTTLGFGVSAHEFGGADIHSSAVFEFAVSGILSNPQYKCSINLLSTTGSVLVEFVHRSFTTWKPSGAPHCLTNDVRIPDPAAVGPVSYIQLFSYKGRGVPLCGLPTYRNSPVSSGEREVRETDKQRNSEGETERSRWTWISKPSSSPRPSYPLNACPVALSAVKPETINVFTKLT